MTWNLPLIRKKKKDSIIITKVWIKCTNHLYIFHLFLFLYKYYIHFNPILLFFIHFYTYTNITSILVTKYQNYIPFISKKLMFEHIGL